MNLTVRDFIFTVAGAVILAFGTAMFILPYNLIIGGVSGAAIIIKSLFNSPYVTEELLVTLFSWVLFFVGLFTLGRDFAKKTLLSTIIYPLSTTLFLSLFRMPWAEEFFGMDFGGAELILAAIFGGALVGVGCALTFLGGGSTGGLDIIALMICKSFPKIRSSVAIFALDALILISGMLVLRNFALALLGITSIFVNAAIIDKIFLGSTKSYTAEIMTQNHDEICKRIIENLQRTATVLDAVGAYSGKNLKLLKVSFNAGEYRDLMNIIKSNDPKAFVNVYRAHEINGEGWHNL